MSHTKLLIALLALVVLLGTGFAPTSSQWIPLVTEDDTAKRALADSLLTVYGHVYHAAVADGPKGVVSLMDPLGHEYLRRAVRSLEYRSVASYLEKQVSTWPDADTLFVRAVDRSNDWVRLTLTGKARPGFGRDWTRYTVVLFRSNGEEYCFAAMTSFEKQTRDQFGHAVSIHETELPELFRFPKVL
jgi:hypothetical protein